MQLASSTRATAGCAGSTPRAGSIARAGICSSPASACIVASPPGGHWFTSASPRASASA
jgi:hypothetical protein